MKSNKQSNKKNVSRRKSSNIIMRAPARVNFGNQAFPPQLFNTVRYVESVSITLGAGGDGYYNFSCNGLFDPNNTGTGHQPLYFDQLMSIYDHYTVLSSTITIQPQFINIANPFIVATYVDDDTAGAVGVSSVLERPDVRWTQVFLSGGQAPKLTNTWNAKRIFGPGTQADPSMQGTAGANPTEASYFLVYVGGNINVAVSVITLLVSIDYKVVWDEFVTVAQS